MVSPRDATTASESRDAPGPLDAVVRAVPSWVLGPVAVLGFVVAVQLLSAGTRAFGPVLEDLLRRALDP
ncbi:MAG: hypothetical protein ABEJ77_03055, partial [Halanaeroarchaeum sp.]